jgi:N-acetylneuraminic acid mutarotase
MGSYNLVTLECYHPFRYFLFFIRYDPKTDAWTLVSSISSPRDSIGVCLLGDKLYAVGGYDGMQYLSDVECYDPQTNEWSKVGIDGRQVRIDKDTSNIYMLVVVSPWMWPVVHE